MRRRYIEEREDGLHQLQGKGRHGRALVDQLQGEGSHARAPVNHLQGEGNHAREPVDQLQGEGRQVLIVSPTRYYNMEVNLSQRTQLFQHHLAHPNNLVLYVKLPAPRIDCDLYAAALHIRSDQCILLILLISYGQAACLQDRLRPVRSRQTVVRMVKHAVTRRPASWPFSNGRKLTFILQRENIYFYIKRIQGHKYKSTYRKKYKSTYRKITKF